MNIPMERAFCRGDQRAHWRRSGLIQAVNSAAGPGLSKQSLEYWIGQSPQAEARKWESAAVLIAARPVGGSVEVAQ